MFWCLWLCSPFWRVVWGIVSNFVVLLCAYSYPNAILVLFLLETMFETAETAKKSFCHPLQCIAIHLGWNFAWVKNVCSVSVTDKERLDIKFLKHQCQHSLHMQNLSLVKASHHYVTFLLCMKCLYTSLLQYLWSKNHMSLLPHHPHHPYHPNHPHCPCHPYLCCWEEDETVACATVMVAPL